jgi:hypothetical protein
MAVSKNKNQHGGKRKNAGRKPVDDPKVQLSIYVNNSAVEGAGGPDAAKIVAIKAIEKEAKKKK